LGRPKPAVDLGKHSMTEQKFDVFLCHNSEDKPAVIEIAQQLRQNGLNPWLDVWELQPGAIWQFALEQQIECIGAAAVFVGQQGLGPWQSEEVYAFLQEFIRRKCPVIPVMLPDAPQQPNLPIFLRNRHWVDFRLQEPDPLEQLIWGITGQKLDEKTAQENELIQEKGGVFTTLESLLRYGSWEEADIETARIMISFSGDESETEFVYNNISKFSCGVLLEIDYLWMKYSDRRFGFASQREIWSRSRRKFDVFSDKVGWRVDGIWLQDNELNYSLKAPPGHLPSLNWVNIHGWAIGKDTSGFNLYRLLERYSSCLKLKSRGKYNERGSRTEISTNKKNSKGFQS
jgi:hypothetical protein